MASPKKKNTEAKGNKGTAGGGGTGRFCKRVSAKRPVRRLVAANFAFSEAAVGALQVCFVAFLGGRKDVRPPRSSQTRGICVCSSHNTKTMGDHCFEKCVVRPLPKKFCDTFWEPCLVC